MTNFPRITFGIIVLNGEPFTHYTLRALYPFAHEIIVVEGAAPGAANVATPDGHSTDGTLETLHRFKAEEDPENKLQIITRDGFWSEKDEMSQAYAERATGDYLWQVDVDEFYLPEDMQRVIDILRADPEITAVSFKMLTFWGSPNYIVDGWYLRRGANIYHRLFKWGNSYRYVTHRPPTVHDEHGRDLRKIKWIQGHELEKRDIVMYHYSLLFPKQVMEKGEYYGKTFANISGGIDWAKANYIALKYPFHVHNVYKYPSWLERFRGKTPPQIQQMQEDILSGVIDIQFRPMDDAEKLLNSFIYLFQREIIKRLDYPTRLIVYVNRVIKSIVRRFKKRINR